MANMIPSRSSTGVDILPPATECVPSWITQELIAETLETWQPYYNHSLTPNDAIEMLRNVGRLFEAFEG